MSFEYHRDSDYECDMCGRSRTGAELKTCTDCGDYKCPVCGAHEDALTVVHDAT